MPQYLLLTSALPGDGEEGETPTFVLTESTEAIAANMAAGKWNTPNGDFIYAVDMANVHRYVVSESATAALG